MKTTKAEYRKEPRLRPTNVTCWECNEKMLCDTKLDRFVCSNPDCEMSKVQATTNDLLKVLLEIRDFLREGLE